VTVRPITEARDPVAAAVKLTESLEANGA
jgi:hypothetical protein